jgi:hypothetical protein
MINGVILKREFMVKRNEKVGARSNVPLHIAKSQVEESTQLKPLQELLNENIL